jgi:hypothetical protein
MLVDKSARGFCKNQIISIDNGRKGIKIKNPLQHDYDGLPPRGTVLPGDEDGTLPGTMDNPAWVVLTINNDGTVSGRKIDRGSFGAWQYISVYPGMVAFDQAADDAAHFFLCS